MDWELVKPVSSFFLSCERPDVVFVNRVSYLNSETEFRFLFLTTRFTGVRFSTLITAKGLLNSGWVRSTEKPQTGKHCSAEKSTAADASNFGKSKSRGCKSRYCP